MSTGETLPDRLTLIIVNMPDAIFGYGPSSHVHETLKLAVIATVA
ncbi:hypothetical protein [Microvirga flavescens]|nr:hypothetical protein [Microvirga flavescens]